MTVTVKWENFQESTQGLVINLLEQEKLLLRFCPCYCVNFLMDDQLNCLNKDWLGKWKGVPILREATAATTRQGSEIQVLDHNMALQIVDLAGKDSTVAIASIADPMYYFYPMKDISDGEWELYRWLTVSLPLRKQDFKETLLLIGEDTSYITCMFDSVYIM